MKTLRYTLLSDGSSDRMLMPLLTWLLQQHCPTVAVESEWADLARVRQPPRSLPEKIKTALDLYPCDILFIHRDAENETYETRYEQICQALDGLSRPAAVFVIPVRMQEAWLLFDDIALRLAAGNPNGRVRLNLPLLSSVENMVDPKRVLFDLIRAASGLSGRRLKKLETRKCAFRVAESIADFSPLRTLHAFQLLEEHLKQAIGAEGWTIVSSVDN